MTTDMEFKNSDLPHHTLLLRDQYCIESKLVQGGFGITYMARDSLDRQVVIKECFPSQFCCRDGVTVRAQSADLKETFSSILRQFQYEARRLAALSHPNIVGVHQVFEENGTAYMAMEFVDGVDLTTISEVEPERFQPDALHYMLTQALGAIKYTHDQGFLHGDIAPDNFLLGAEDYLTLIDFGAADEKRKIQNSGRFKILAVKEGFSPHEYYTDNECQDASSDLYSLAATFYYLITGAPPPDGKDRFAAITNNATDPYQNLAQGAWGLDNRLLASIDQALAVLQKDRIQSADEWLDLLNGCENASSVSVIAPSSVISEIADDAICQLVSATNTQLTPGLPEVLKRQMEDQSGPEKQKNKPTKVKQWVDIFGNPIKDVDAFLREQDRQARKNPSGAASASSKLVVQIPPVQADNGDEKQRRSVIGKMFGSILPKKRSTNPAIIQT
ncbi:Serine/threonine-protein kinase PknB [Roseovarius litorisediminis]|uniref:Serine/threonine-protein kinase PknB n=2 Tax=Roseovarius litorisediminis TaxID=1312363 RepID=A0A1Y5T1C7_9RHOB|nr:Serine/threonine-protein kinase PknB [Roseovarius litorisediminis]